MFKEYGQFDTVGLAALVAKKEITPKELLEEAKSRTESLNPKLNAIVSTRFDRAQEEIEKGLPEGPFTGVPFLMKDLSSEMAGEPFTNGSRFLKDNVPKLDSEMVRRYRKGGLVIFGKTNTPEFGANYSTEPRLHGPTLNPWDVNLSPGGSSGGSSAAIAAGIVPAAHASDGGGSIRVPASLCGLFGMKPTRGRNPFGPQKGESLSGMSTVHALSRSVRDSAALMDLTCGPDVGAPYFAPLPKRPFLEEVKTEPGKLRIAYSFSAPTEVKVDSDVEKAVMEAVTLLKELGHDVKEATPEIDKKVYGKAMWTVWPVQVHALVQDLTNATGRAPEKDEIENIIWAFAEQGKKFQGSDYVLAINGVHQIGREIGEFFESYDVYLTPVTAKAKLPLGHLDMMLEDLEEYFDRSKSFAPYTALFNVAGNPAMSVPLHWTDENVPVGVQFAGAYGNEATLFQLAGQLERAKPWKKRKPPAGVEPATY